MEKIATQKQISTVDLEQRNQQETLKVWVISVVILGCRKEKSQAAC